MILKQTKEVITLQKGNSQFAFLASGDTYTWLYNEILVNQLLGNPLDGSINNLYLRVYKQEGMCVQPLLGIKSNSKVTYGKESIAYSGAFEGVSYEVIFHLASANTFFFDIKLQGEGVEVDVVYGQDISIASIHATQSNELYVSQYIDYKVLQGNQGYVICSRQNQKQGQDNPYLQLGCLNKNIISYCTDGMQFFKKQYKKSNEASILSQDLPEEKYQFELAYIGLQSEKMKIEKETVITFYGHFELDHPKAVETIEYSEEIKKAYETISDEVRSESHTYGLCKEIQGTFVSDIFTEEELNEVYPVQNFLETQDDQILSFFTPTHEHVITQSKELLVERAHGHIITSGIDEEKINNELITSTSYMYGIFEAQVVIGNTNLNKLSSTPRSLLNTMKHSGMRIYVKMEETYKLLTLPAIYEIGINHARWYYRIGDDTLCITSFCACDSSDLILQVTSQKQREYAFIVSNQLNLACHEFQDDIEVIQSENMLTIKACEGSFLRNTYPDMMYCMHVRDADFKVGSDEIFYDDHTTRNASLLTLSIAPTTSFNITIEGHLEVNHIRNKTYDFDVEKVNFHALYERVSKHFHLSLDKKNAYDVEKLNEVFWWYTHNALVHYAVPHGLEQPGGAAWGTRDICQGPFEYFMATQNFTLCRAILVEVFAHQFYETGEWPQWFMFDKYRMQQDDSHGDVVFWPLKIIGDYIKATQDESILEERVVYRKFPHGEIGEEESILDHIHKAVKSIEERFLYDTHMITYAGGDWDDTLQPANPELKEKLVSAWTMALAYQSMELLASILKKIEPTFANTLQTYSEGIKNDFLKRMIKDDVIAGFAKVESMEDISFMLHPDDQETGIKYRLLPLTRSIIANLVDDEQAQKNVQLIDEHLKCEDGVRLMNCPARYLGGVSTYFQRAEQASNVGREVGLQYAHAHVRYIEAMAKLGLSDVVWDALYRIVPIKIQDHVKNANLRQSNCYFSSSDGDFKDRYDYQENFDKLRKGDVAVKAGWRIYSSGPGIYLNQIVSNVLGMRYCEQDLIIDPVLSKDFDGLKFDFEVYEKPVAIHYHIVQEASMITSVSINGHTLELLKINNGYRSSGVRIKASDIKAYLEDKNTIEVTFN